METGIYKLQLCGPLLGLYADFTLPFLSAYNTIRHAYIDVKSLETILSLYCIESRLLPNGRPVAWGA